MGEQLTSSDVEKIEKEIEHRKLVVRKQAIEEVKEARAQGDLSENFEYRAARRAQAKAISRIKFLQKVLEHSRIIDTAALPKDRVSLLSKVEFTHLGNGKKMCYTIVGHHEMDHEKGKLSCKSPIGAALMGHQAGETVEVKAPAGTFSVRIESITLP